MCLDGGKPPRGGFALHGAVVNKVLDMDESREWHASMLPHLDKRGKAELTAWLDGETTSV